jgi:hypothetical protein
MRAALILSLNVIQVLAVLSALTQPAYAYIDPGSGLFALQTISTTVAGVVFLIRKKLRVIIYLTEWDNKRMIEHAVTGQCNGIGEKDTCVLSRRSLILYGQAGKSFRLSPAR